MGALRSLRIAPPGVFVPGVMCTEILCTELLCTELLCTIDEKAVRIKLGSQKTYQHLTCMTCEGQVVLVLASVVSATRSGN